MKWPALFMRKFCANLALTIYLKLEKGAEEMMAMLFVNRVILGTNGATFEDVPAKLKAQVADILVNECGMPELVPVEFGGTQK